jgi:ATP-binding cassette subfamily B protein
MDLILGKRKYGVWDADTEVRRDYWQTNNYLDNEKYLKELKIFGSRNYLIKRLKGLLLGFQERQLAIEKKRFIFGSGLSFISGLGFGLVYLLIVKQVISGQISIGTFTFYVASVRALSGSISSFLRSISRLYEEGLYTVDLYKLIDIKPLIKDGTISYNSSKAPLIEFTNVGFKYPFTKKYIFKDLNLKIKPGEHIAIVGENGAGKSTFVSLLSRFYDASEGKILINGTNVNSLKQDDWHKSLALLSQDFVRYHFDVKANIGIGNISKMDDLDSIKQSAQKSGASGFIEELDHKYDTALSKRYKNGTELSTGQWQKIALARAFFKNSPILILDEPTSAIDPKAEYEIFEKLFDFAKDKTVIIISHRFSTVRNADRIIVLDDGKIVEEGSHKDLIKFGGQYKEAFDLQKKGYDDI